MVMEANQKFVMVPLEEYNEIEQFKKSMEELVLKPENEVETGRGVIVLGIKKSRAFSYGVEGGSVTYKIVMYDKLDAQKQFEERLREASYNIATLHTEIRTWENQYEKLKAEVNEAYIEGKRIGEIEAMNNKPKKDIHSRVVEYLIKAFAVVLPLLLGYFLGGL